VQDTVTSDTFIMRAQDSRRKRFKAALALAGVSLAKWAEAEGVTRQHVNEVLSGKRVSAPLNEKINEFTARHLSKVAA
jgi:gp16 family phage-associated protein